jgi:CDP-diglyceride synthetase
MIKRVATAVVLIPLVLLLVLKAPLYVLALVAGAVALLAIAEFLKLATHYGVQPLG